MSPHWATLTATSTGAAGHGGAVDVLDPDDLLGFVEHPVSTSATPRAIVTADRIVHRSAMYATTAKHHTRTVTVTD